MPNTNMPKNFFKPFIDRSPFKKCFEPTQI
jgi:hypothetical protein